MSIRDKITKEQHLALIAASNLLCEFAEQHLPPGWEISLNMRSSEADLELTDPSGTEIYTESPDYGISSFGNMCDTAWEIEDQRPEPDLPEGYHDEPEIGPSMRDGIVY